MLYKYKKGNKRNVLDFLRRKALSAAMKIYRWTYCDATKDALVTTAWFQHFFVKHIPTPVVKRSDFLCISLSFAGLTSWNVYNKNTKKSKKRKREKYCTILYGLINSVYVVNACCEKWIAIL